MRLLFAAPEGRTETLASVGVKGIFTSYLAWRGRTFDFNAIRQFDFVFVDSGAHLYMKERGKGRPSKNSLSLPKPDEYVEEYITFLKENWDAFDYFSELDIGHAPLFRTPNADGIKRGAKWVKETRQKFIDAGLGKKLVPVYHPEYMSLEDLDDLCRDYPYVGIGQMAKVQNYAQPFEVAKKYETKLHGFAMTKEEFMKKLPFYSVDSASWLSGARFGTTYYFKGAKLYQTADKEVRRTIKAKLDNIGVSWERVMEDDPYEVDRMNAHAWVEYNDYLNRFDKSYWKSGLVDHDIIYLDDNGELPKRYNPADNLPERTRGKIMSIREDPKIEEKRITRLQKVLVNNTFNTKHKGYSIKELPEFIQNYIEDLDYVDFNDPDQIKNTLHGLLKQNLKRIAMAQNFELQDGGYQDKALSKLTIDTMATLEKLAGIGAPQPSNPGSVTATQINIGDTKGLSEDERLTARGIIGQALERLGNKTEE